MATLIIVPAHLPSFLSQHAGASDIHRNKEKKRAEERREETHKFLPLTTLKPQQH